MANAMRSFNSLMRSFWMQQLNRCNRMQRLLGIITILELYQRISHSTSKPLMLLTVGYVPPPMEK